MSVEVGDKAPDFTLRDQHGQEVTLSDFRGSKNVLLAFYPLAMSRTCQGELCEIRDDLPRFENDEVQVLTVSVDSVAVHRIWADRDGFTFPLLSDFWPHGEVARQYDVLNEAKGTALRGTFVIDKEGLLRWKSVNAAGDARDQSEWVSVLAGLGVPGA